MAELMKGHKWRDHRAKMTYPAWAEIKHDEIRCRVVVNPQNCDVVFLSYAEKPLANMERFAEMWADIAKNTGWFEFDTGFEVNGNYNDSYRWVRSTKGLKPEMADWVAKFYLFDLPANPLPYTERYSIIHNVWTMGAGLGYAVHMPHGWWVNSVEEVDRLFTTVRSGGFEGLMVKDMQHKYVRDSRSYGWQKVKPEDDADGRIMSFTEAVSEDGTPLGRVGSVTIAVEDGSVASPHGIPHELATEMWLKQADYYGRWVEFKFMERDRQGGYRHPVWGRLREDKA